MFLGGDTLPGGGEKNHLINEEPASHAAISLRPLVDNVFVKLID